MTTNRFLEVVKNYPNNSLLMLYYAINSPEEVSGQPDTKEWGDALEHELLKRGQFFQPNPLLHPQPDPVTRIAFPDDPSAEVVIVTYKCGVDAVIVTAHAHKETNGKSERLSAQEERDISGLPQFIREQQTEIEKQHQNSGMQIK